MNERMMTHYVGDDCPGGHQSTACIVCRHTRAAHTDGWKCHALTEAAECSCTAYTLYATDNPEAKR